MDYTPNKNYNQRIEAYQEIYSSTEDVGNISKDDVDIDFKVTGDMDEDASIEPILDFSKVTKTIENSKKDVLNNVEMLLEMVKDDINIDMNNAINLYINEVNSGREEGVFPYEQWENCANFKKAYSNHNWSLTLKTFEKATDFELDSNQKISLYLDNLVEYLNMKKGNHNEYLNFKAELERTKELLKKQSKLLGENKFLDEFYEHLLFNNSIYPYIYNILEDIPEKIQTKEWSDYATITLTDKWNKPEGDYLWEKWYDYLTMLEAAEKEKFIVKFLKDFLIPKNNLPVKCFKNEKINWEEMLVLINHLEQYHSGIYNKVFDQLKTKIYDEKLKEELEKYRFDFKLKKELTINNAVVNKPKL